MWFDTLTFEKINGLDLSPNLPKMPQNVQRWPEMAETMRGGAWRTAHAGYLLFPLIPDQTPELSFGPIRHEAGPDLRLPTRWNPRQICPVWLSWLPGNRRSIEIKVQSSGGGSSTLGMLNHLLTMEKGVGGGGGRIRHSLQWLEVLNINCTRNILWTRHLLGEILPTIVFQSNFIQVII